MKIEPSEIAAMIALAGVITSTMIAFITSSRSVYVNAITSARIKWLESIADHLIDFQHMHFAIAVSQKHGDTKEEEARSLNRTSNTIRLQLNQSSFNEQNLIKLMGLCSESYKDYEQTCVYNQVFSDHANWFIKTEWRKIKAEARSIFSWPNVAHEVWKRQRDYNYFCNNEGAILPYEKTTQSQTSEITSEFGQPS